MGAEIGEDHPTALLLRDATIELVSQGEKASAREITARAGASLGAIRHHYGSIGRLRRVCDEYCAQFIKEQKTNSVEAGVSGDVLAGLRNYPEQNLVAYLAHRLVDDADSVDALIDLLIDQAEEYTQAGIDNGVITPTLHLRNRVAMSTIMALGTLLLHRQVQRYFGLDLTARNIEAQPGIYEYIATNLDVFGAMLTDEYRKSAKTALAALDQKNPREKTGDRI